MYLKMIKTAVFFLKIVINVTYRKLIETLYMIK